MVFYVFQSIAIIIIIINIHLCHIWPVGVYSGWLLSLLNMILVIFLISSITGFFIFRSQLMNFQPQIWNHPVSAHEFLASDLESAITPMALIPFNGQ